MTTFLYSITHIACELESFKRRVVWILGVCIVSLVILNGFFVISTILNVVEREQIFSDLTRSSAHILSLESEYAEITSRITIDFAETLGFYEVKDVLYVTRTGLALNP